MSGDLTAIQANHAAKIAEAIRLANEAIKEAREDGVYACVQSLELNRVDYLRPTQVLVCEIFGTIGGVS